MTSEFPRLALIAAQIAPEAHSVLDVGYDHGKLLGHIHRARPALRLIGGELLADAAGRAEASLGVGVADLRTGDGLSVVDPGEVDVVVLAGLTDRTILKLLQDGRGHLPYLRQVICCPSALEATLRPGLAELGLRIIDETIAFKRHRSYDVIICEPGDVSEPPHPWGPVLVARRDLKLARHLAIQRQLFRRDFETELKSHRQPDGALDPMGRKLIGLEPLLRQAEAWVR